MPESRASDSKAIAPFRIEPQFVTRVWGYRDLRPWFDRVADGEPIGEVWLTGDDCLVATGLYSGQRLADVFGDVGQRLIGAGAQDACSPLLIKVLFAQEKLSVQVHPDDALARRGGFPRGKTECWYALSAEPGAEVAVGLKPGTTTEEVAEGIQKGTLEDHLATLTVQQGDMVFVDAGTVHAIWPGSVLLETQQNCDLTYRMYDYGRPRELHIEKSLEALRLKTRAGKVVPREMADRTLLLNSEYFRIERVPVTGTRTSASLRGEETEPKLAYLFAAAGAGRITGDGFDAVDLPARGIIAVPVTTPEFVLEDAGGLDLLCITANMPIAK
jgi:mannose-6-phosphate isomerase